MFGLFKRKRADVYDSLFGSGAAPLSLPPAGLQAEAEASIPTLELSALSTAPLNYRVHDGSKFDGGYGATDLLWTDYWTLRQRSAQLFQTNLYARGIIRRLVTNEINTGLHLEATPEEALLGREEDSLADWAEDVENRFALWSEEPTVCDNREQLTFGALQALARLEALVCGDVLVVLRQDQRTGLPRVQLISGAAVQTPWPQVNRPGARIVEGVELDSLDRHVAYWIAQEDGTFKRLPAWGEKTGRRLAWLVYGTERRLDEVRGQPLLALVLQSLREIDRYRDSTQRKATINSLLAVWIKKTSDKPSTRPLTGGGAMRRGVVETQDSTGTAPRTYRIAEHIPGLVLDELQQGEEPQPFSSHGTDERFGTFEEAIVQGIGWALEIPPEILRLTYSSNYSASQAAINEFKMYLNKTRNQWGKAFCQPIYCDWLLSAALLRDIEAPGYLEGWRNPGQYVVVGAWSSADWTGHIKPAVDQSKLVGGYKEMVAEGFITRDRASRELTGTKYSKNVAKLARENAMLAEAIKPLAKEPSEPEPAIEPEEEPETPVRRSPQPVQRKAS
ncbi:MAG TPA: phage portal protein [Polyangiaceae bacterium]|nr:phage portal protein [Polyangiaceae bacterium]